MLRQAGLADAPRKNILPIFFLIIAIAWAATVRGGPSFAIAGVALVRADGRLAARWQAALRGLLVWGQAWALLFLGALEYNWLNQQVLKTGSDKSTDHQSLAVIISLTCVAAYVIAAVWLPRRPWHDRVTRTHLVPR